MGRFAIKPSTMSMFKAISALAPVPDQENRFFKLHLSQNVERYVLY